jgi:serine/threonine protein kinase
MSRGVRYRVLRKIAHGGMAEIFTALQIGAEGFEKPVVLKRILPALSSDPAFVRMLVDEAHIVSSLNHSHLVQVLDLGKADDQFFLVLEFVDGWSLEQVRRRARKARLKLPLPLALYVVSALCRGLDYVHRRTRNGKPLGIVHRDVTPQNVLLSREGEVKLADFGIAKASGRREKSATGVIKGKFAYMSPEQSVGAELDARSDLFSVGTLLYLLTTGQKPFDAATDLDVLMQVRKARFEKPSTIVRDYNPDVERFVTRALRADRARRWQSAEQMADRVDQILVKLGQPSGPAALKRWLETLSARDGVPPPGELKETPPDVPSGTLQLVSGDLELQHLSPPDEPPDDDDDDELSTSPENGRARSRVASLNDAMSAAANPDAEVAGPSAGSPGPSAGAPGISLARSVPATGLANSASVIGLPGSASINDLAGSASVINLAGSAEATIDLDLLDADLADDSDDGENTELSEPPAQMEGSGVARLFQPAAPRPAATGEAVTNKAELSEGEPSAAAPATAHAPHPEATSALLLTKPAQRRAPPGRFARWARRAAVATLLVPPLLAGGVYFGRPFLPAWLVPVGFVEMVDDWLGRLPRSLDDVRGDDAAPTFSTGTSQR